jgi:hypothetical protein
MATAAQEQLSRILKQPSIRYQVTFNYTPLTWDTDEPNNPAYTSPIRGNGGLPVDLASKITDWDIQERVRQLSASLRLTFREDVNDEEMRAIQYNDLIEVYLTVSGGGEKQTIQLGTFLVDRVEIEGDEVGMWVLDARDVAKMLTRRRYFGNLKPTRIRIPTESGYVTLTKNDKAGLDYIEFFHDPGGSNLLDRTINWCHLPKPIFKVSETSETFLPDGENAKVIFGDGLVRIGREWFNDKVGTNNTLQVAYYRYALWEDTFANPDYDLNSPTEIIQELADWGGFQTNDPGGLLYIESIDSATYPLPFDRVITTEGTDRTHDAAGGDDFTGVSLYMGCHGRRFPAIHWSLATPSSHPEWGSNVYRYYYWNGAGWIEVTPSEDTTDDLRQSGFVAWFNQDLSSWAKNVPIEGLPEAYYIRILPSNPAYQPTVSYVMAGHPIQCQDIRVATDDDLKPHNVLDRIVKPAVPPNYRWGATRQGNFVAVLDVENVANPDFTLDEDSRISITYDQPHEDDIRSLIIYRGQSRERTNAALAMNGATISNLQDVGEETITFSNLINGDPSSVANLNNIFGEGSLPTPEADLLRINLGGIDANLDIREVNVTSHTSDDPISLSGLGVWPAFESAVTDNSDSTSWDVSKIRIW